MEVQPSIHEFLFVFSCIDLTAHKIHLSAPEVGSKNYDCFHIFRKLTIRSNQKVLLYITLNIASFT